MTLITRKTTMLIAVGALAGSAIAMPAVASAKSYKFNMKVSKAFPQVEDKISANYNGKPFGKCTMKGKLVIPNTQQTWKCKGGTFYLVAVGKVAAVVTGTWKVSKGTGKFKGIKGKGTFSGKLSDNIFTYKGTVKY